MTREMRGKNRSRPRADIEDQRRRLWLSVPYLKLLRDKVNDIDYKDHLEFIIKIMQSKHIKNKYSIVRKRCKLLVNQNPVIFAELAEHPPKDADSACDSNELEQENKLQGKVQNVGYSGANSNDGKTVILFKCFRPSCDFFNQDSSLFIEHLRKFHLDVVWNHFCESCSSVIHSRYNGSILDEMHHLQAVHTNPVSAQFKKISEANPKLRPWLRNELEVTQSSKVEKMLKSKNCLIATYKCMERSCDFVESCEHLFGLHLVQHEKTKGLGHTKCCYCVEKFEDSKSLISHVKTVHANDVHQCSYCFYRSVDLFNVLTHIEVHHEFKKRIVIKCSPHNTVAESKLMGPFKSGHNIQQKVRPIPCLFLQCSEKFFLMCDYNEHLQSHKELALFSSYCSVCKNPISVQNLALHLEKCWKIGLYQCLFCIFGTNSESAMKIHLADFHPTMMTHVCHRSGVPEADPKLLESMKIKKLKSDYQNYEIIEKYNDDFVVDQEASEPDCSMNKQ